MTIATRSNLASQVPAAPRTVRRKWGRGDWFAKVFIFPHTVIGVWLLLILVAEASCALWGHSVPGRVVGALGVSKKYVGRYTIEVAYDVAGSQRRATGEVGHRDYERLTSADASPLGPQPISDLAPSVRVQFLSIGPWHYAHVLLPGEHSFDESRGMLIAVPLWNAFIAAFVYHLYVRPWRQRRLYRYGVLAPGETTAVNKIEGKGGHYAVRYAFALEDGTPVDAKMKVPLFELPGPCAGDSVRVLHYPRLPRPSVIYEHGDFIADGVPSRVDSTAARVTNDSAGRPPRSSYRLAPRSGLIGRIALAAARIAGRVALVCGMIGFFTGFFASAGLLGWVPADIEFPLGQPTSVAVDHLGRIYVASRFYSRVQQYDPDGRFVRGWFVYSSGGSLQLRATDDDRLEAATSRGNELYTYRADGRLIGKTACPSLTYYHFEDAARHGVRGPDHVTYDLRSREIYPRVVRTDSAGVTTTVVSAPWYKASVNGPLPAWFLFAAGIVTLGITARWAKRRQVDRKVASSTSNESPSRLLP